MTAASLTALGLLLLGAGLGIGALAMMMRRRRDLHTPPPANSPCLHRVRSMGRP